MLTVSDRVRKETSLPSVRPPSIGHGTTIRYTSTYGCIGPGAAPTIASNGQLRLDRPGPAGPDSTSPQRPAPARRAPRTRSPGPARVSHQDGGDLPIPRPPRPPGRSLHRLPPSPLT